MNMKENRLFNEPIPEFHLPQLPHHYLDDALDEMELLGFTLCNPFELVEDEGMVCEGTNHGAEIRENTHHGNATNHGVESSNAAEVSDTTMLNSSTPPVNKKYISASNMPAHLGKIVTMLGYLITWKPVHTIKRELMYFGTFIDANGDWLDTVHFPDSVKRFPLQGKGFYRMAGRVVEEFGVYNLDVQHMQKVGIKSRAASKAGTLLEKQKNWQQGLIRRE
jgi:DNA polymerase-3 subunit alpha